MKYFFSVCYIAALFYCKTTFSQIGMSADSLIKIENEKRGALTGTAYPSFKVTLNNTIYSNENLKGKTVFINFWFTACKPCMKEMDELNKLYGKFKDNKNFEFISFTFDNDSTIAAIKKKFNIGYNIYSISIKECYRLNLNSGFPTSFVLDAVGNIKYMSRLAQQDNFVDDIYPLLSKE